MWSVIQPNHIPEGQLPDCDMAEAAEKDIMAYGLRSAKLRTPSTETYDRFELNS